MLDLILEVITDSGGWPDSPDRLSRQRQARFVVAVVSGGTVLAVHLLSPAGTGWTLLVAAAGCAAAWVAAFSLVDLAKERSAAALSGLVLVLASAAAAGGTWVALARIATP